MRTNPTHEAGRIDPQAEDSEIVGVSATLSFAPRTATENTSP